MKKLLILILIALLIILSIFIVINGANIGSLKILGINAIQEKNDELDTTIQEATRLATVQYKSKLQTLNDSVATLEKRRTEYEQMATVTDENDIQVANQFEKYNYEKLLVDLGNHATSEGADLKIEIIGNGTPIQLSTTETIYLYDANFTVTGSYVAITSFISSIENDNELGFKIESFKMTPGTSTSNLKATFTCRNIPMSEQLPTNTVQTDTDTSEESTTNTTNTTNNTNSTNTTNTTNNTSTTNITNTTNIIETINNTNNTNTTNSTRTTTTTITENVESLTN